MIEVGKQDGKEGETGKKEESVGVEGVEVGGKTCSVDNIENDEKDCEGDRKGDGLCSFW